MSHLTLVNNLLAFVQVVTKKSDSMFDCFAIKIIAGQCNCFESSNLNRLHY